MLKRDSLLIRHGGVAVTIALIVLLAGCVTTKERGDRAMEAESYRDALEYYETAMERGSNDPDLYAQAADAAVRTGDFALAERYYSRSLRYGGGEKVARKLSEFYIATSNYTKAVRVLQELIESADDKQPLYNNLGTALMYAGAPLEAESYLLVAQQLDPDDPVPYINLGLLYDEHLNQPRRAIGFYRCFVEMSSSADQRREITTRAQMLEQRYANEDLERFEVTCGEAYQGPASPSGDEVTERLEELKKSGEEAEDKETDGGESEGEEPDGEETDGEETDGEETGGEETGGEETGGEEPDGEEPDGEETDGDGKEGEEEELKLELEPQFSGDADSEQLEEGEARAGGDDAAKRESDGDSSNGESDASDEERLERAEEAFEDEDYEEVVEILEAIPVSKLDAESMSLYGRALVEEGEDNRARRWLVESVEQRPRAENVRALVALYERDGKEDEILEMCETLQEEGAPDEALNHCPTPEMLRELQQQ
ncbi:MAG: tetratricopeptide repeat protein [Persicimonas sp.]